MSWNAQIIGGPRDGEWVPYSGAQMRLPVPPARRLVLDDPDRLPPEACSFGYDLYEIQRGYDFELYYVRRANAA